MDSDLHQQFSQLKHQIQSLLDRESSDERLLPTSQVTEKNFKSLQPPNDEPLTLTLDNSVIRVTEAKATCIIDIGEWTSAFTAYMSVIINNTHLVRSSYSNICL